MPTPSDAQDLARRFRESASWRSTLTTWAASRASTAAEYPEPVPTSSTSSEPSSSSAWQIAATIQGWEIVCSSPIGSAESA